MSSGTPEPSRPSSWLGRSVLARPGAWLLLLAVATIPFAAALPRLHVRTDGGTLHPDHDAIVAAAAADRERFRDPEAAIALVSARSGSVFTPEGLRLVQRLTDSLHSIPGVRGGDVASLATLVDVTSSTRTIRLAHHLDPLPATRPEADRVRATLDAAGLHAGVVYGRDGRSAAIYLPIDPGAPRADVVRRLRDRVRAEASPGFVVRLTGPVVAEVLLGEQILADIVRLVPVAMLVVTAALWLGLRSAGGVAIPVAVIGVLLTWTLGAMSLLGVPLTLVTSILPVLLMAMAVTDQIHWVERLQVHLGAGLPRAAAIVATRAEVGPPIVRTALTTAIGFLAFTTASVPPLRHFGAFACGGLLLSMALSFTLVPAMLRLLPEGWLRQAPPHERPQRGIERWAARRPGAALAAALLLAVAACAGLGRLRVQDSWVDNFHPASDLAVTHREFDTAYRGAYSLDLVLESGADGFFRTARGVRLVDSLACELGALGEFGGVRSLPDVARAALRGVDPSARLESLGDDGVAQLLLLVEMAGAGDEVDRWLTRSGREARLRASVPRADYARARRVMARVDSVTAGRLPDGVRARKAGDLAVATQVVRATVGNQVRSVAATLIGLVLVLAISFRSVPLALLQILPVAATTLMVFGGMGHFGVPLGVATSMFAALAEGEGVNYTIHIVSRFLSLRRSRDPASALDRTLASVGPAVRWNGIALVGGCAVLCLSSLRPVRSLGLLLAAGMALSYAMAFLVLPYFLRRTAGRSGRGGTPAPRAADSGGAAG